MAHGIIGSHHHSILASRVGMVAHVLFLTTAVLMLVWLLHYRGGVNIQSEDPEQIFNVRVMCYDRFPLFRFIAFVQLLRRIGAHLPINKSDARSAEKYINIEG